MTNGRFGKVEEKEMDETKERFNEIDEATSDETTESFVPQALLTAMAKENRRRCLDRLPRRRGNLCTAWPGQLQSC